MQAESLREAAEQAAAVGGADWPWAFTRCWLLALRFNRHGHERRDLDDALGGVRHDPRRGARPVPAGRRHPARPDPHPRLPGLIAANHGHFADRACTSQGPQTLRSDSGPCEDPGRAARSTGAGPQPTVDHARALSVDRALRYLPLLHLPVMGRSSDPAAAHLRSRGRARGRSPRMINSVIGSWCCPAAPPYATTASRSTGRRSDSAHRTMRSLRRPSRRECRRW